jgi:hypothetical protein
MKKWCVKTRELLIQYIWVLCIVCLFTSMLSTSAVAATSDEKSTTFMTADQPGPVSSGAQKAKEMELVRSSTIVTLIVACTTLGVIGAFVAIYLLLRSDSQGRYGQYFFGEGLLMQMLVVLIISECVFALAIAGVLGATEVGTIYGGIVGYVLGSRGKGEQQYRPNTGSGNGESGSPKRHVVPSVDK